MNKNEFLKKLDLHLNKLSAEERQDILQDFEEHFTIGLEEGKTEEEISASLGSPNQIAKEILTTYHLEKVESHATIGNIFRAVWATIGIGFFNIVIVLGPFIALVGLIFAGWTTGIAFIVSPLLVLINTLIYPDTFELFDLFVSISLSGLGLFITIAMYFISRLLIKAFIKYLQFNVKLVKGGLKND
ncbi:MAG TPA: DUF1700 domain-containing protein [Bacillus bacterium]|nr:DUF1700 domain-containing protein [Bacillus sp. (in: firmicutes)]